MTQMNTFWPALKRAWVELIESESGEFMTTREKSRLLDAMMRDQRGRQRARKVSHFESNEAPLIVRYIPSA